jgi:hypothetical protein
LFEHRQPRLGLLLEVAEDRRIGVERMPGRSTFTTTSFRRESLPSPTLIFARCTWPIDPLFSGFGSIHS